MLKLYKVPPSNKKKTVGQDDHKEGEVSVTGVGTGPFIDKISVIVDVAKPEKKSTYLAMLSASKNSHFTLASMKPGTAVLRAKIPGLLDSRKWPHLTISYSQKLANRVRVEFVPVDLGLDGLTSLHKALSLLVPGGWQHFIVNGRVTRIDVAMDFPNVAMTGFRFLPKQGVTTDTYRSDGALQTHYHGKKSGNQTVIYDRAAKRTAQKKGWQGKTGIRIERRLRNLDLDVLPSASLAALGQMPNPFKYMAMVEPFLPAPPNEKSPYIWELFNHTVDAKGLTAALGMLPEKTVRKRFRAYLASHSASWWTPEKLWTLWEPMIATSRIADADYWSQCN